jgi:cobalt-zinc-cadmium efflux system protein
MNRLRLALALNAGLLAAEVIGAIAFSSLALIADAAHNGSDIGALTLALIAAHLSGRPASKQHSYGFGRAEVLAALANSVLLVGVTAWVAIEAVRRFWSPVAVRGGGLALVGFAGTVVNAAAVLVLSRGRRRTLNIRAATLHMGADVAGSLAASLAGVAVLIWNARWFDPAASLMISVLVVIATWRLLTETVQVLLEGTPRAIDPHEVETVILGVAGVEGVHHLHVWTLGPETAALSGHVVATDDVRLHDAQVLADELRQLLARRFGIAHATLEMECHNCETETPVSLSPPPLPREEPAHRGRGGQRSHGSRSSG